MDVENSGRLWLLLPIGIIIGAALVCIPFYMNITGRTAIAYACGFVGGQAATIHQIEPSRTAKPEIPTCAKFREIAIAAGFTPAGREVNRGR